MKENEVIVKRQKFNNRFKNEDMDFFFNWAIGLGQILGMAPSQVFVAIHGLKDGDAVGWREGFMRMARTQLEQAQALVEEKHPLAAGEAYLGSAYAYRFALQYIDPTKSTFDENVAAMEKAFLQGITYLGVPLRAVEIPFENASLPGYYLELDRQPRPTLVMIGGGDSFREDLFYFAGYPGWKRGYNVLMVDLPGQGKVPGRGLHYRADMGAPISTALDWLEANAAVKPEQVALYGISGGGWHTAQAAASDRRIRAWIAATPIFDMGLTFVREFGPALKTPGWLLNLLLRLSGSFNESAEINLNKYAWQFGMPDLTSAVAQVTAQTRPVNYAAIQCPSLFLISEGEAPELKRQTMVMLDDFKRRGVDVSLREFTAEQGADGHCELNNLRLLHMIVFDWLDRVFGLEPGDVRQIV
ncbi:MAG: alpha/beta fold hydrolase [Anaerolineales bacterium]